MCNTYAEIGFFVLIYLVYLWSLISIAFSVWPTCDLLHVLHCNFYIPLEFILLCGVLSHKVVYGVTCSKCYG